MTIRILYLFMNKDKNMISPISNIAFLLGLPTFLIFLVFLLIPIIFLNVISLKERDITSGVLSNWSLEAWYFIINNNNFHSILFNSLKISFSITFVCLIIAYLLLFTIRKLDRKIQTILIIILLFPISFDTLIITLGWLSFLGYDGLLNILFIKLGIIKTPIIFLFSEISVFWAQVINFTPLMTLSVWLSFLKIERNIILGAEDLGASSFSIFLEIILPLTKNGIQSGGILVFTSSLVNFIIPEIVGGDKKYYLGNLIKFELFEMKNWAVGSSISICVYLISIITYLALISLTNYNWTLNGNGK